VVTPLCIVDHAEQGLLLGRIGQQAQGCQPDEKAIRSASSAQPKGCAERLPLRAWEAREPIQHRCEQLVQRGKCELHLGFDAGSVRDAKPRRVLAQVLQQSALSHPRLSAHDQRSTTTLSDRLEQLLQGLALALAVTYHLAAPPRARTMCGHFRDTDATPRPAQGQVRRFARHSRQD
jgi:hypothetical protein